MNNMKLNLTDKEVANGVKVEFSVNRFYVTLAGTNAVVSQHYDRESLDKFFDVNGFNRVEMDISTKRHYYQS